MYCDYVHAGPGRALEDFCLARRANRPLMRDIQPAELDRTGVHSDFGKMSLRALLANWAGSDLVHTAQIQRIIMALLSKARTVPEIF